MEFDRRGGDLKRAPGTDRRRPGRGRRARDRLATREATKNPRLRRYELANLMLFVDDDLREAALAMGGVESFLGQALRVLENPRLEKEELLRLVQDRDALARLECLGEAIVSLRRRMALI